MSVGRIAWLLVVLILICAADAGCGGSPDSPKASAKDNAEASQNAEPGLRSTPPDIPPPAGVPPKKLVIRDLQQGTGTEAHKGDEVQIQYYGIDWLGNEHANSWHYTHIPVFILGQHRLLRGMNRGIVGMKEGGSREIIIPYNLVYYPGGHHVPLAPLDALVYKVYLVDVLDTP